MRCSALLATCLDFQLARILGQKWGHRNPELGSESPEVSWVIRPVKEVALHCYPAATRKRTYVCVCPPWCLSSGGKFWRLARASNDQRARASAPVYCCAESCRTRQGPSRYLPLLQQPTLHVSLATPVEGLVLGTRTVGLQARPDASHREARRQSRTLLRQQSHPGAELAKAIQKVTRGVCVGKGLDSVVHDMHIVGRKGYTALFGSRLPRRVLKFAAKEGCSSGIAHELGFLVAA